MYISLYIDCVHPSMKMVSQGVRKEASSSVLAKKIFRVFAKERLSARKHRGPSAPARTHQTVLFANTLRDLLCEHPGRSSPSNEKGKKHIFIYIYIYI